MAVLTPNAKQQFFDNQGRPLTGGKLFTYAAGTSTKLASYVNSAGVSTNSNPILLDYRGECNLWVPPNVSYKYVLSPANDTDPPTNPIWTVDNVVDSQLITLYGGVSTGSADAYILTFTANFSSYVDGTVIYFLPNFSNVGAATINVNGLGPLPILNQDLSALYENQIVANRVATIIFIGTRFLLVSNTNSQAFNAQRITSVQSMPASTVTDCVFNNTSVNQGGRYSTTNGIYTALDYGIYTFNATVTLVPAGTNCVLNGIYFSKNNATSGAGSRFEIGIGTVGQLYSNTGNSQIFAGSITTVMSANDTMRMKWDAGTSGAATNTMGLASSFSGAKVA